MRRDESRIDLRSTRGALAQRLTEIEYDASQASVERWNYEDRYHNKQPDEKGD
jgi:hypothetical protein